MLFMEMLSSVSEGILYRGVTSHDTECLVSDNHTSSDGACVVVRKKSPVSHGDSSGTVLLLDDGNTHRILWQ